MGHRLIVIAALLTVPVLLGAQATEPSFQLVSIRRTPPAPCPPQALCIGAVGPSSAPSTIKVLAGGRFEVRNGTLESLVRVAFGLEQVDPRAGMVDMRRLPSARVTRFDITAVADREWSTPPAALKVPPELRTMLRQLLETRFKLRTRTETKKVDVAVLRLAGTDPGPGLRRADGRCLGPLTVPASNGPVVPACAYRFEAQRIEAGSLTMPEVATLLTNVYGFLGTGRTLVDDSGLIGRWDVALDVPRTALRGPTSSGSSATSNELPSPDVSLQQRALVVRDAVAKQLGLKIVNAKRPVPILEVEHAENPQED